MTSHFCVRAVRPADAQTFAGYVYPKPYGVFEALGFEPTDSFARSDGIEFVQLVRTTERIRR